MRQGAKVKERLSALAALMRVDYPSGRIPQALWRLAWDPVSLSKVEGLRFWKLGGTGTGLGFSARPNWNQYIFFATWDSKEAWQNFLRDSPVARRFKTFSREWWWVTLAPVRFRGSWNKKSLFSLPVSSPKDGPVAILTRATICWNRLARFWGAVDSVSASLEGREGLACSVGFGEIPWKRQATFSIWNSQRDFESFAYETEHHSRVIQRTREEGWYAEELFARFMPLESSGTWGGRNPLEGRVPIRREGG